MGEAEAILAWARAATSAVSARCSALLAVLEGTFDAALSRWGIIFEPEPEATAPRIRGFLKPEARMAIASWGAIDRVPMFPAATAGNPGSAPRPTREAIAALLEGGGFSNVEVEDIDVVFDHSSPEEFVTCLREIASPITALLSQYPQDVQDEAWARISEAAREHAGGDGPFTLSNQALLAVGEGLGATRAGRP